MRVKRVTDEGPAASSDGQRIRVLLLGEDAPGALMHSYEAGFRRAGAVVRSYCLRRAFRGELGHTAARIGNRLLGQWMLERFNKRVVADLSAERFDLIVVLKGEHLSPDTVAKLKTLTRAQVVNFYPDDPFSDSRANKLAYGPEVLREYDHCFTFASNLLERYQAVGAKRVSWLPFARDPDMHSPVEPSAQPDFDVVFAGNLDAERVRWLEPVAQTFRLAIFAENVRPARGSELQRATFLPAAYGPALASALARGAISLNIMRVQNQLNHNMRSFESPACGAFTLSQRTPELERMFRENEEIAFVSSPREIVETVRYWLVHPDVRKRIRIGGIERVAEDTYEKRAWQILRETGLASGRGIAEETVRRSGL